MPPRTLLGLILCNLVWSAHPLMNKWVLADFGPPQGAWLRYTGAVLAFLPVVALWPWLARASSIRLPADRATAFVPRGPRRVWPALALMGFLAFCLAPLLQMTGLESSRATDNALIIAMEPLMALTLAAVFLRERASAAQLGSFAVAIGGFALLSGLTWQRIRSGGDAHLAGNLLMLVSLVGEAGYSVTGRRLVARLSPLAVFAWALLLGYLSLNLALIASGQGLPDLARLTPRSAFAVAWVGVLGTTVTYFYWVVALVRVPVASISLTLFVQPLMGAIWGYVFLEERLSGPQLAGGALILLAVLAQTLRELRPGGAP